MRRLNVSTLALGFGLSLALAMHAAAEGEQDGYLGDAACLACHEDLNAHYQKTVHARLLTEANARSAQMKRGCEACHGPGRAHVEVKGAKGAPGLISFRAADAEAVTSENGVCLGCHEKGARLHWQGSAHDQRDVACTSCHSVMQNTSDRNLLAKHTEAETCSQCHLVKHAQLFRNSHMPLREGKMSCSSCHAAHGSASESLLVRDSVNDTCYACHAEKRGPYLWEHAPVTESCLNCHDPHGSTQAKMLKLSAPRLCQQCHIETLHPTEARRPGNKFVISASCLNCHQNIHGSNHPSGFAFTR